jgi:ABC-type antimicrobial peptide transport system permease subunit
MRPTGVSPVESPEEQQDRDASATHARTGHATNAETGLAAAIRERIDPAEIGLFFLPVRQQADAAAGQATDFGQLFLGFSFFLLAAALLLAGLLFVLGVRHRSAEVGTLLALGFPPRRVRRLFLAEGAVVALAGAVAGTAGGLLYTRAMLAGLATVWSGAVASATVRFHVEPATLVLGAAAGVAVALLAIWIGVARQARLPARVLLSGEWQEGGGRPAARRWPWLAVAAAATIVAAAIILSLGARRDEGAASGFFGAGALLLVAAVAFCRLALDDARAARRTTRSRGGQSLTLSGLARRNSTRRIGRSLAAVALLACGTFLVVAIGANRQDANQDAGQRSSGTGGFALVGESAAPITRLEGMGGAGGSFQAVPLRVHEGDDASCLNLNRAQRPRVLGVRPEELARRGAFRFEEALPSRHGETSWDVLNGREEGVIPAVADETTITWALGRKVGDTIDLSDERGQTVRLRLVAALANSVLQGSLIISDADFLRLFPSDGGYRMFLIDAAAGGEASVATNLSRSYENSGLQVTPAARRLAAFNEVENAYLSIFQLLGGLGLLLGSAGLGVVVLRNVLERRGELAILRAVGFTRRTLRGLVLREHLLLLAMGLASGAAAGAVAVLPAIRFSGQVPWLSLGVTLAAIGASGALWVWLAAATALRGPLLPALRNE